MADGGTPDTKAVWEQKMAPKLQTWLDFVEKIKSTHAVQLSIANKEDIHTDNAFTSRTSSLTMPLKFRRESVTPFRRESRVLVANSANIENGNPSTTPIPYRKDSADQTEAGTDLSLYPILPDTLEQVSTGLNPPIMEGAGSVKSGSDRSGSLQRTAIATSVRMASKTVTGLGAVSPSKYVM